MVLERLSVECTQITADKLLLATGGMSPLKTHAIWNARCLFSRKSPATLLE